MVRGKTERADPANHRGAHREPYGVHTLLLARRAVEEEVLRVVSEPLSVPRAERPDPLGAWNDQAHDRENGRERALAKSGDELDDETKRTRKHVERSG